MVQKMRLSRKPILLRLLTEIELDVRSNTGKNLRNLILETSNSKIEEGEMSHIENLEYFKLGEEEEWRVEMLK